LFNSMKIIIIVFKFAIYSLELEIKLKKIIHFRPTYPIFFTMLAKTQHFVCMALQINAKYWRLTDKKVIRDLQINARYPRLTSKCRISRFTNKCEIFETYR
jgi:hypothetical protein